MSIFKKDSGEFYSFSITPFYPDRVEEHAAAIIDDVKRGVYKIPLFCASLVPEGDPIWDKVTPFCESYRLYKEILDREGVKSGVLIQSSLGHGWPITRSPYERYVGVQNGEDVYTSCPLDERFVEYLKGIVRAIAKENPAAIMLDDDFRLINKVGHGCACPRHVAEFNRRTGENMTREELTEYIFSHPKTDKYNMIFLDTQRDSLVNAARAMREAIDEINPDIQGMNCTTGYFCEFAAEINKAFAGKGNPTMVRMPNGVYAPASNRGFSLRIFHAAICSSKLRSGGIDIILSENDTIPKNRYGMSARYLHSHLTASILEGVQASKMWLTRGGVYEPASGKAYRNILTEHKGYYEKLIELSKDIKFVGINSLFSEQDLIDLHLPPIDQFFITQNIERMGIPFFFSDNPTDAVYVESRVAEYISDGKIAEVFEHNVFLDVAAAEILISRGYGDKLGVEISEWDLGIVHGETCDRGLMQKQKNHKKLTPTSDKTKALTYNVVRTDNGHRNLAPATTELERENGKKTVVFCGSPKTEYHYTESFSFLNESRKEQLIEHFKKAGALPIYAAGDDDFCLRAGYMPSGELLACITNLGTDPAEPVSLYLEKTPKSIKQLTPQGRLSDVSFRELGNGVYEIDSRAETMYPVVLIIK